MIIHVSNGDMVCVGNIIFHVFSLVRLTLGHNSQQSCGVAVIVC